MHHIVRVDTRIGRKLGSQIATHAAPLIRRREQDLAAAGVERVERVSGVRDGLPVLADGRVVDVPNVLWCTGFRNDFGWIDLPVFDTRGEPVHRDGITAAPGLYFIGLQWLSRMNSSFLSGVGQDAARLARHIAERRGTQVTSAGRAPNR